MTLARFRAAGAAFALVLLGIVSHAALQLPGVQGPFLGDQNTNLYTVAQAINQNNQVQTTTALTANTAQTQAAATQLQYGINQVATVASATNSVALPACVTGALVFVTNDGGNSMTVFGQNGRTDTINGTAGATGVPQAAASHAIYVCAVPGTPSTAGAWLSIRAAA
jgi:hypothetical protein